MNLGSIFAEGVLFDISAMSLSHSHSVSHPHTGVTYSLSFESSIFLSLKLGLWHSFAFLLYRFLHRATRKSWRSRLGRLGSGCCGWAGWAAGFQRCRLSVASGRTFASIKPVASSSPLKHPEVWIMLDPCPCCLTLTETVTIWKRAKLTGNQISQRSVANH